MAAARRPHGDSILNPFLRRAAPAAATALLLAGCTSPITGERVDYKSASVKVNPLEVPPDLTQLNRDGRYQTPQGSVSASALASGRPAAAGSRVPVVAPLAVGEYRVERDGDRRWLVVPRTPDEVWPLLLQFWDEMGFTLEKRDAASGVIVTNWAENRAKLPQDIIRGTLGGLLDTVYSTGELDQFRMRVERTATGSEIFITHKGLIEVYTTPQKDFTKWEPRPTDPELENEFLQRLLVKLGASKDAAQVAVANPMAASAPQSTAAARARVVAGAPGAAFELDDGLDRAWRRVGIALDRSGFTVEDRDRAAGLYFVRYVDPKTAGKDAQPGFFARWFGGGSSDSSAAPVRYQVALKSDAGKTRVSVLNSQGAPDNSENSQRIVAALVNDLK
jgi:outer membrane protein assembly factor BamC